MLINYSLMYYTSTTGSLIILSFADESEEKHTHFWSAEVFADKQTHLCCYWQISAIDFDG